MEKITYPYIRQSVFSGVLDRNLKKLEGRLGVNLSIRGDSLWIDGDPKKVEFAKFYFEKMSELQEKGFPPRRKISTSPSTCLRAAAPGPSRPISPQRP